MELDKLLGTGRLTWDWTNYLGLDDLLGTGRLNMVLDKLLGTGRLNMVLDKLLGTVRLTWDWTTRPWPAASSCSPPDTSAPAGPPRPPGSTPGRPSRRGDVSASSRQRHPSRPSRSPSSSPTESKRNFRDIENIYKAFYAVVKSNLSHFLTSSQRFFSAIYIRERNVLFNDALNTFYLRLNGVRHMVKDHSDSEKGNLLPPHRLLLSINSKGDFYMHHPTDRITHTTVFVTPVVEHWLE